MRLLTTLRAWLVSSVVSWPAAMRGSRPSTDVMVSSQERTIWVGCDSIHGANVAARPARTINAATIPRTTPKLRLLWVITYSNHQFALAQRFACQFSGSACGLRE